MRRRRGPAAALATTAVLFTMWFVGSAVPAQACTCAIPPDEATRDAAAETIIVGRVTAVTQHEATEAAMGEVEYRIDVEVLHKGEITDPVSLWTARDGALCGVHLDVDLVYKLYPRRSDDGRYRIGLCDGNRQATQADLEPLVPTPDATATTGTAIGTTSSTGPPASVTTSSTRPFGASTSTAPALPTSTSTSLSRPSDAVPAIGIDDEDDGDGTGVLLPAVGVVAVTTVGAAALAVRRLRNQPPPLTTGLPPMHAVHRRGRRSLR